MMRRALLRLLAMTVAGGLPPRRPDQVSPSSPAGVAPGASSGITRARLVIISGPSSGMFLYSGAPGTGDLVESVTEATADPFNNPAEPGFASYDHVFGGVAQLHGAILRLFSGVTLRAQLSPAGMSVFNTSGALIFSIDVSRDAWLLYADTGSAAQGALLASASSVAGTDSFGNTVDQGIANYSPALNAVVQMLGGTFNFGSPAQIALTSGKQPGSVGLSSVTEGTAQISSGLNGATDVAALLLLWSKNAGGAGHPFAQLQTVLEMFTPASLPAQQGDSIHYDSANAFPHFRAGTLTGDTVDYQAGHAIFRNTSDQTGIGTSPTVIAGLSVPLGTGLYNFRGMVSISNPTGAAITPAVGFSAAGGLAAANLDIGCEWFSATAGTFKGCGKVSVLGNSVSPTSGLAAAEIGYMKFDGVINVSTAGTLQVFAFGTAVNLTVRAFSRIVNWPDN